jgi:hypothetical protein
MQKVLSHENITESQFRNLINEAPFSAAVLSGDDLIIELANEISLKLWGKDKSIIGKRLLEALPEMQGQPVFKVLKDVYNTGITYEGKENVAYLEVNGIRKKLYVNFVYKAIHDDKGRISGVFAAGYDVSEHVEAREKLAVSEERARLAVDAAGMGTFELHYPTGSTVTSPRFDAIFGFSSPRPHID